MIVSSYQLNNVKYTNSWKRGKHFGNTGLERFTLMGLMKRKNIYIKSPFEYISEVLTFPLDTAHCDIELAFDCFVFPFSLATLYDYP